MQVTSGAFRSGIAALLLAGLAGCSDSGPNFGGPLAPRDFQLGGARYRMNLPEQAAISEDPGGAFVWIELRPGERQSPSIWLEAPYDSTQPFAYDHTKQWSGALSLEYRTGSIAVGSGGPEASLDGKLAVAEQSWSVACATQGDDVTEADATWCLPLLGSIEIAPS